MLRFQVEFFEEKGKYPVEEFLKGLSRKAREKVAQFISLLEEKGIRMPYSYCKKLIHSGLWELKVSYRTDTYRIFFCYYGDRIVLLHGVSKKTDETPRADIELAERRMERWLMERRVRDEEI